MTDINSGFLYILKSLLQIAEQHEENMHFRMESLAYSEWSPWQGS